MKYLRYYCNMVLPLVYDETLSYYELLCKVVAKLNELISENNKQDEEIKNIESAISELNQFIQNFDTTFIKQVVDEYITIGVYFGLSSEGYFIANIPGEWENITFRTTEYDYSTNLQTEYGHLVLLY